MKHCSVVIDQHSDGTATVSYEGPTGRSYRTVVDADCAVLFSSCLIGWAMNGLLFEEGGSMSSGGVCHVEFAAGVCGGGRERW